jgi:nicotinate-nucleotide adenylyltransferase
LDLKSQEEKCLEIARDFSFMPLASSNYLHPLMKESVTFFGGSFYPFHEGHRACLDLCPEKNIIVVLDRNPLKALNDFLPYEEYLKIKEALRETNYLIYPGFLAIKEKNPTSDWLPNVKAFKKNFLMGDDSFLDILKWKNPEKLLLALSKLYIVPRKFSDTERLLQKEILLKINPKLEIIFLPDHPYKEISSSVLRATS